MIHPILPQTKTTNELGAWIAENALSGEKKRHEEKVPYTPQEIAAFEHDAAVACREIDRLEAITETVKVKLKEGIMSEVIINLPVTTGLKVLEANRKAACDKIERGYRIDFTDLYAFPWPEKSKITFVDVKGNHWEQYDHVMNPIQEQHYSKPLLAHAEKFRSDLAESGMSVSGFDKETNTLSINVEDKPKKEKKKKEDPQQIEMPEKGSGADMFSAEAQGKPLFDSE